MTKLFIEVSESERQDILISFRVDPLENDKKYPGKVSAFFETRVVAYCELYKDEEEEAEKESELKNLCTGDNLNRIFYRLSTNPRLAINQILLIVNRLLKSSPFDNFEIYFNDDSSPVYKPGPPFIRQNNYRRACNDIIGKMGVKCLSQTSLENKYQETFLALERFFKFNNQFHSCHVYADISKGELHAAATYCLLTKTENILADPNVKQEDKDAALIAYLHCDTPEKMVDEKLDALLKKIKSVFYTDLCLTKKLAMPRLAEEMEFDHFGDAYRFFINSSLFEYENGLLTIKIATNNIYHAVYALGKAKEKSYVDEIGMMLKLMGLERLLGHDWREEICFDQPSSERLKKYGLYFNLQNTNKSGSLVEANPENPVDSLDPLPFQSESPVDSFKSPFLPHEKVGHYFQFDNVLTTTRIADWESSAFAPIPEECIYLLRPEVIKTLRAILNRGDHIAIITSGTEYRIAYILENTGLTKDELKKIILEAENVPAEYQRSESILKFYEQKVKELLNQWSDTIHHVLYAEEYGALPLRNELKSQNKNVYAMYCHRDYRFVQHLRYAQIFADVPLPEGIYTQGKYEDQVFPPILPTEKCVHYFDFDGTLTREHVEDWGLTPPSKEKCKNILKPEVIETFRAIWERGDAIAIITNGTKCRVPYILKKAGLAQEELEKIRIEAAESPYIIKLGFKDMSVRALAENEWPDAKYHFFYDDREDFRKEIRLLKQEFKDRSKHLIVYVFGSEQSSIEHLRFARETASRPTINRVNQLAALPSPISFATTSSGLFTQEQGKAQQINVDSSVKLNPIFS